MPGFFKKFTGDSTRGKNCKDCGHPEAAHHLKMIEPEPTTKPYNNLTIRANCRECDCMEFK